MIDLDIRAFFDSVPWDLVLKAVAHHSPTSGGSCCMCERWLKAPLQQAGRHAGRSGSRDPAGFGDLAVAGEPVHALRVRRLDGPGVPGRSGSSATAMTRWSTAAARRQARQVRDAIAARLAQVGLELHPDKTRIVYCKDADRRDDL